MKLTQKDIDTWYRSPEQVAELRGCSLATIRKQVRLGKLPYLKWQDRPMIHVDDVLPGDTTVLPGDTLPAEPDAASSEERMPPGDTSDVPP